MKKFLFLLTLCLLSFSMQGKVVIFESQPGYYPAVLPLTFNVDGVTLSVYGSVAPPGYRFYTNGPSSISTSNGVIKRIEFENASGSSFTFSTGSVVDYGTTAVWSGYASEIVFYVNVLTGRIIVTLDVPEEVSCGIGEYDDHYDEMIVSAYDAVVLAQSGKYLYFKDETGFGLAFGSVGQTYKKGDVIPAGFGGKVISYSCHPELTQTTGFQPAKGNVEVVAEEITFNQIDEAHWAHYVVIRGVTYDPVENVLRDSFGNEIPVYNRFNVTFPEGVPFDVYGIIGAYGSCPNTVYQLIPTEIGPDPGIDSFEVIMVCTYQNGINLYGQIREIDASSGCAPGDQVLVYGNVGDTFTNGDIIRGHYQLKEYNGMTEFVPVGDWEKIGETGYRINPELMTIEDVSPEMIHNYLSFNGVTLTHFNEPDMTIEDETGSLLMFNKFDVWPPLYWSPLYWEEINVDTILALIDRILTGKVNYNIPQTYYVEGFLSCYGPDHTLELLPTYIDLNSWVANDDINGDGEVNLADVNELINYILWDDY